MRGEIREGSRVEGSGGIAGVSKGKQESGAGICATCLWAKQYK